MSSENKSKEKDFHQIMKLKIDHNNRPLWVCNDRHIFLETFSPFYQPAYDFLIAIAEPVCRPELIHEYKITQYSLIAASSVGLRTDDLISGLNRLSKNELSEEIVAWIRDKTSKCGKLRLVLKKGRYFLESIDVSILDQLLCNDNIFDARKLCNDIPSNEKGYIVETFKHDTIEIAGFNNKVENNGNNNTTVSNVNKPKSIYEAMGLDAMDEEREEKVFSFEIDYKHVEQVKKACNDLDYPCVEEYDFRNDKNIPDLDMSLKPIAKHRPYQEKCLSKMFGNGRARSGIIVLPCGAGKTLVGITACATVKKSTIIFANTTVSVHQWYQQILHWSKVPRSQIIEFSSRNKQPLPKGACILITTYHMLAHQGKRSKQAQQVIDEISSREWGLIVLDEVHVTPAKTFRKCTTLIHSKCKLGLTATLLREDEKIEDLHYLIGPKLYEANWLDLQKNGYLATVQCVEVWCPMTPAFYRKYLESRQSRNQQMLSDFNPNKFRAMEYLIRTHEARGDKVLVFSDNIELLKHCSITLNKPYIYGETRDDERKYWLSRFNSASSVNCLFISSVGDTSIDLPDVNVVIQISSHFGSRRQEAQRLGRILRPKPRQGDEFNAFFYTLVSKDTIDMVYATKRQRFLVDQGYSFHVLTDLVNEKTENLHYSSDSDQHDLLTKILTIIDKDTNIAETIIDDIEKDESEEPLPKNNSSHVRTRGNNLDALSGANGVYNEVRTGQARGILSNLRNNNSNNANRDNDDDDDVPITNTSNTGSTGNTSNTSNSMTGKKRPKFKSALFLKEEKRQKTKKLRMQMYLPK